MNMPDEVARISNVWTVLSVADGTECLSPEKRADHFWKDLFNIKQSSG